MKAPKNYSKVMPNYYFFEQLCFNQKLASLQMNWWLSCALSDWPVWSHINYIFFLPLLPAGNIYSKTIASEKKTFGVRSLRTHCVGYKFLRHSLTSVVPKTKLIRLLLLLTFISLIFYQTWLLYSFSKVPQWPSQSVWQPHQPQNSWHIQQIAWISRGGHAIKQGQLAHSK